MSVSVIINTHNNYSEKDGCIEAVVLSVLNQIAVDFEIIVVDNASIEKDRSILEKFISGLGSENNIKLLFNIDNNVSVGRNLGYKNSNYDMLIFMDDDIFLEEKNVLHRVEIIAIGQKYGYGAIRKWTTEKWYKENKIDLYNSLKSMGEDCYVSTVIPDPTIRRKKNCRHLLRTYIGNFGFIYKDVLAYVGGWDEFFNGYGIEDDSMAFKLYMNYGTPCILAPIYVIHFSHKIKDKCYEQLIRNKQLFDEILHKNGIKCFHGGRLLYNEDLSIIEYL